MKQAYEFCMPFLDNTPSGAEERLQWTRMFSLPEYREHFTSPERHDAQSVEQRSFDDALAFYMSWSGIAVLPDGEKEKLKAHVAGIIGRGDGRVWVDEKERILEFPFATILVTFRRTRKEVNQ